MIGALLVGVAAAKSLAYCHDLPLLGINHVEGHIYANCMEHPALSFPHICLTVSGGHTLLVEVQEGWRYEILGTTQDDAAGEAYDKVAQYLGLGFPGGKVIDDLAKEGDSDAIRFPRPMLERDNYQFSFSGVKTAVRFFVEKARDAGTLPAGCGYCGEFSGSGCGCTCGQNHSGGKSEKRQGDYSNGRRCGKPPIA